MTTALDRVIHACTVSTAPTGGGPRWAPLRLRVRAECSCLLWEAEGTVNPEAPAYDPAEMPTRLRTLHRDHCADDILDAHGTPTADVGGEDCPRCIGTLIEGICTHCAYGDTEGVA